MTRPSPTAAGCICIDEGIRSVIVCGWIGPAFGSAPYTSGFESGFESDEEREAKRAKASDGGEGEGDEEKEGEGQERKTAFQQPALITGATLKDYQLEGVAWMAGLHQNGISGILGESP